MLNEAKVYFVTIQTDTQTHKAILALNEVYAVLSMSKQHFHTRCIIGYISLDLNLGIFAAVFSTLVNYGNPNRKRT